MRSVSEVYIISRKDPLKSSRQCPLHTSRPGRDWEPGALLSQHLCLQDDAIVCILCLAKPGLSAFQKKPSSKGPKSLLQLRVKIHTFSSLEIGLKCPPCGVIEFSRRSPALGA
ncbi:hypothetical protein J6590_065743 [Homalodisca vitripennis]|nr:hypothetical protein J6590_065743 [Homalodisca vitripennis]